MIKLRRPLSIFLLLAAIGSVVVWSLPGAATSRANNARPPWNKSQASQLVFFAVLEGLYRDGVSNDVVDLIIPPGTNGMARFDQEHFVYACPLCHPAFEAFRLYRHRGDFYGFKGRVDSFGSGLDDAATEKLRSSDPNERRKGIEDLISRWVTRRLDMMRLSDSERQTITREMEEGRKVGMGGLKQSNLSRTNCPICDGGFGACKNPVH